MGEQYVIPPGLLQTLFPVSGKPAVGAQITPITTAARVEVMGKKEWPVWRQQLAPLVAIVFGRELSLPESVDRLKGGMIARKHVVGLLVCMSEAVKKGQRPDLIQPEAHLRPQHQTGLAALLLALAQGVKT